MKFKTLMILKALVCLSLGAPILIAPVFLYSLFGADLNPAGVFAAREYGASLIGNLCVTWFARNAVDSDARRAIIRGSANALVNARPTAVAVRWATNRMLARYAAVGELLDDGPAVAAALRAEAEAIIATGAIIGGIPMIDRVSIGGSYRTIVWKMTDQITTTSRGYKGVLLTWLMDSFIDFCSVSSILKVMIFSTPLLPMIQKRLAWGWALAKPPGPSRVSIACVAGE